MMDGQSQIAGWIEGIFELKFIPVPTCAVIHHYRKMQMDPDVVE